MKKIEELNANAVNLITFFSGIILVLIAILVNIEKPIGLLLISIGTSIIASSIVVYLSSKYLFKQNKIKEIIEKWGLSGIYRTRAEMNLSCNDQLNVAKCNIDIIAFGLKGFRETQTDLVLSKVKSGINIRIITINPNSSLLTHREKDEGEVVGQIKNTILQLDKWVFDLKKYGNVKIKYYDTLPFDFYFRIDNKIYVGPYLYGQSSQQTISYEFSINSQGFDYYISYFEKLWNDNNLLKDNY
ncbi:hypothetical protein U5907_07030 [Bacteroidales bacterium MB20-C3-3]|nr:hypothetical protein U5907_07030 [Bacteroidales bacterium MB20-C3-3]